ncbi:Nn.00g079250.m01.CDS01 [Neocucurbitaria sp. VM-36]
MWESPIPKGKVRARWTCRCGARLFDDFIELKADSVAKLEQELQGSQNCSIKTHNLGGSPSRILRSLWGSIGQALRIQVPSKSELPTEELRQPAGGPTKPHTSQHPNSVGTSNQNALHLLLCMDRGSSGTPLRQEQVDGVTTDRQVFHLLRRKYFELVSITRWFTLRSVVSLSLSRFALDFSNYAEVHKHPSVCATSCVCLPPLDKIDREYRCCPAPEKQAEHIPAIGSQRLTHYFFSPHCVDAQQKTILAQLPKKIGRLSALNDQEAIGWGIHIQEGWHWKTVYSVFVVGHLQSQVAVSQ